MDRLKRYSVIISLLLSVILIPYSLQAQRVLEYTKVYQMVKGGLVSVGTNQYSRVILEPLPKYVKLEGYTRDSFEMNLVTSIPERGYKTSPVFRVISKDHKVIIVNKSGTCYLYFGRTLEDYPKGEIVEEFKSMRKFLGVEIPEIPEGQLCVIWKEENTLRYKFKSKEIVMASYFSGE